jgi:hypothetical protein
MDLSIRVIAFNTFRDQSHFASRHPHLSVVQIFKDQSPTTQRQQRDKIMKHLQKEVKTSRRFKFIPRLQKEKRLA